MRTKIPEYDPNEAPPEPGPCSVILACNRERISEADVEFLDISEDERGADVLTFKCPRCGQSHKSNRYG